MSLPPTKIPAHEDFAGRLIFLGTGTSHGVPVIGCGCPTCSSQNARNQRTRCAVALGLRGGNLLIDTPPELRVQLLREHVGLIHAVLYTHAHADHLMGLDDLRIFPSYLGHEVPIYCEHEVEEVIRRAFQYVFDSAAGNYPPGAVPRLAFRRVTTEPFEVLGTRVIPIRQIHGRSQVLGYRFGDVAYCTDVKEFPPESADRLQGLDVLILDALRREPHPTHLNLDEALEIIHRLRPKRTLLTHIAHRLEHEATNQSLPPGVELAYDGLRIPL
ncbi:MAG: MBL fold metallo-hydrolase [Thermoguttaceae bacterium]